MPRNAEVIRQWKLLLHLDGKSHGSSVDDLSRELGVTKRTIWRDLAALQEAGFPLVDEKRDRKTTWRVLALPLKSLTDAGLSVTEVCSLYMSRALLLALTGTPFEDGLGSLMKKVQKALSPKIREFLDELPNVIRVRPTPRKKTAEGYNEIVAKLIGASTRRRVAEMQYFSVTSNRQKNYEVHPYRIEYADGGLYLRAYVPEYQELRSFAIERIRKCTVTEKGFTPIAAIADADLDRSIGVGTGSPQGVVLEFTPRVAPYVRERIWHKSQTTEELPDGGVRLTMKVACDWALHGWVLSWGPHVRVAAPSSLAQEILAMLDDARDWYVPRLDFGEPAVPSSGSDIPRLALLWSRPSGKRRSAGPS